ncbi:hypothetical protein VTH82DRAFT_797 [Thermothelomyces myriococcoides]
MGSLYGRPSLSGVLARIRIYDFTGNKTYLNISVEDEAFSELHIKLAASLHNRIANDTKYLPERKLPGPGSKELYRATSPETYLTSARAIADEVLSNDSSTSPQLTASYRR